MEKNIAVAVVCQGYHSVSTCGDERCKGRTKCHPLCVGCPDIKCTARHGVDDGWPDIKSIGCQSEGCRGAEHCIAGCMGCPDLAVVCKGHHSASTCGDERCKRRAKCHPLCAGCPDIKSTVDLFIASESPAESFILHTMALKALFGDKILTKEGEKDTDEALAGVDNILVYFSAHWCPPCRGYTPELSEAYANSEKKSKTAVVFVSSDKDQAAFDDYYGSMSFFALPYSARDQKDALSTKYGVSGIPTLVLLDGQGEKKEDNIRGKHGEYL